MRNFTLVSKGEDVTALLDQLEESPELWDENPLRRVAPDTPHSRMSDIWVRYNDIAPFQASGDFSKFNDAHIPIWYPAWKKLPALRSIIFDLMAMVDGEMLCGVLITRIPPGMGIDRHVDDSWHVQYTKKFYVTLQSVPGAIFGCEDADGVEELNPHAGEIWLFDNRKPHWVINNSDKDRITLIVCIRTEKFD